MRYEINNEIVVFFKCAQSCQHYKKTLDNKHYCDCEGRFTTGPCYRCGGI